METDAGDDPELLLGELRSALESALAEVEQLRDALLRSRRIGAAIGVVMTTMKVTEARAFELLVQWSQNTNRKLRDVADDVVETGSLPGT